MAKLYEITGAMSRLWDTVLDEEANLDVLEDTLQCLDAEMEVKAESIGRMVQMLAADQNTIELEIKRLRERKQAREKRMERIKSYLLSQMEAAEKTKITTPIMTIWVQNNPVSLDVYDESKIPAGYMTIIPAQTVVDNARVKDALKAGAEVPGAVLLQGKGVRFK